MAEPSRTPRWSTLFGRAVLRRCVVCGEKRIFRRWLSLPERCPRCDFVFERIDGHFVGAVGINTILTFGALLITLVVGLVLTAPDVAVGPIVGIGLAVAIIVPIVIHPACRMIWTGIDLLMRPLEPGEAPRLGSP